MTTARRLRRWLKTWRLMWTADHEAAIDKQWRAHRDAMKSLDQVNRVEGLELQHLIRRLRVVEAKGVHEGLGRYGIQIALDPEFIRGGYMTPTGFEVMTRYIGNEVARQLSSINFATAEKENADWRERQQWKR